MKQTRLLLSILALPALLLAGCSDEDGEASSASGDSPSSEEAGAADGGSEGEFVDQVNQSCIESMTAMGEIFGPIASVDGPPSEEMLQETYDALLAQLRSEQEDLEALTPPADMQDDWDSLVAAHDEAVASVEVEQKAVEMGFDACAGGEG
jgi:hypothetical protein